MTNFTRKRRHPTRHLTFFADLCIFSFNAESMEFSSHAN